MSDRHDVATEPGSPSRGVLALLVLPVFVMVIDTTFMNVSITTLSGDLNTSVTGIQSAITVFTLVMAAFMITGGKLSRIWGARRGYTVGLLLYGLGALITAVSLNLAMLLVGWSLLEGLGAALVLPSVNSLIVSNFAKGAPRKRAYGAVAATGAIGAAVGPVIGGLFTTYLSWRVAFAAEVIIVLVVVAFSRRISVVRGERLRLDIVGVVLSATGMALVVLGLLQAGSYGWLTTRRPVTVGGVEVIAAGGPSPLILLVGAGGLVLAAFALWERGRTRHGREPLIDSRVVKNRSVFGGSSISIAQFGAQSGVLFVLPVFMQSQLDFSAFETGLAVLPMSVALLAASQIVVRLPQAPGSTRLIRGGLALSGIGSLILAFSIDGTSSALAFAPGLLVFGIGLGLVLPQLTNLVVSAVEPGLSSEASGMLSTGQNLGRSFGTAVAGGILVSLAIGGTVSAVAADDSLDPAEQVQVESAVAASGEYEDDQAIRTGLPSASPEQVDAVLSAADQSRNDALRPALLAVAGLSFVALLISITLPAERPEDQDSTTGPVVGDPSLRHG